MKILQEKKKDMGVLARDNKVSHAMLACLLRVGSHITGGDELLRLLKNILLCTYDA